MEEPTTRERVIEEIKLMPDHKLQEVYDVLHYFRLGLQKPEKNSDRIMKFAGCWEDMPEEAFREFLKDVKDRREQAFSRRRN